MTKNRLLAINDAAASSFFRSPDLLIHTVFMHSSGRAFACNYDNRGFTFTLVLVYVYTLSLSSQDCSWDGILGALSGKLPTSSLLLISICACFSTHPSREH